MFNRSRKPLPIPDINLLKSPALYNAEQEAEILNRAAFVEVRLLPMSREELIKELAITKARLEAAESSFVHVADVSATAQLMTIQAIEQLNNLINRKPARPIAAPSYADCISNLK